MTLTIAKTAKKHFIDWHQLPLPAAARWLASQHATPRALDMSASVIVVPTSRSKYRLLELLLDCAEAGQQVFTPPEITTVGTFPELLYTPRQPLASPLVQLLAWVRALRHTDADELRNFTGEVPEKQDISGWQVLAHVLSRWHLELAGNGLTFADVLTAGRQLPTFQEQDRWQTLSEIQRRYLDVLNEEKMWDRQTARLVAIEHRECTIARDIYLVGTVDLNPTVRQMLQQVADRVTSVVFAGDADHPRFDELGCLLTETWENAEITVADEQILAGDQPQDQARLLVRFLQDLAGRFAMDEVSVSVPDPRLISPISRALGTCGVKTHDTGGSSIGNTRAFILLELLAAWLDDHRYESFAALVRHPDMAAWLNRRVRTNRWLSELDHYQNHRLPFYVSTDINHVYFGGKDRHGHDLYARLERAYNEIYELVQPLLLPRRKPLASWGGPWRQVLVAIYRDTLVDRQQPGDRRTIRACSKIVAALIEIEESGRLLEGDVSSTEAIHWALELCSGEFVADPAVPDAISLVGWLDTALEDTPVTVVTGVNEGWIPSSESSSLFLPNSLRSVLGLVDNRRRYARDAYALQLVLSSRQQVALTLGRRDEDGQPLMPSRLLLTGTGPSMARRALRLFGDGTDTSGWTFGTASQRPDRQQFPIPVPNEPQEPVNSMRVTDFRQYLACPYRFYLSRVLNLQRITDDQDELDPAQFGSLIHDVVENFGRSEMRNSADRKDIEDCVLDCLNRFALARYGRRPIPTVQIQLEQARQRLRAFAAWQAEHRSHGFEIFEVEREKTRCQFDVDGQPFEVRGQIDRIDINHRQQTIGLYDYKTGDKGEKPRELHQDRHGNWKDLQLPLYHHLLGEFDLPSGYRITTGLILITKDVSQVRLYEADWTPAELELADEVALGVMRNVRGGIFWPPADKQDRWDDFAAICQTRVFEKWSRDVGEQA
jgi:RecB family exonuclease